MIRASPHLTFNGNCRKAMTFYQECFGGELSLQTVAETPMAAQCPESMQDHVMHSMITNGTFVLMASDMTRPGVEFSPGNDMAISLDFDSEDDIRGCFSSLSEGGQVLEALEKKP